MTDATLTAAEGAGTVKLESRGLSNIPRSLYVYANLGVEPLAVAARSLYTYANRGVEVQTVLARSLYLYEARTIEDLSVLARSLYLYEATQDGEPSPWLMKIEPTEQYRGGQVSLYGDGFGELAEVAAGSTITTSSVSGVNVGANAVDRTAAEWVSTSGSGAWIRFTFASSRTIVAVALEDIAAAGVSWGIPEFRFSDGGATVNGGTAVPKPASTDRSAEYPVGTVRQLYALPAPRTTSYVEVRVASGGAGTNRGLSEVWVWEDTDQAAESSAALLGTDEMGIVSWSNRSPGLWPANGGATITAAATVTIPGTAASGLVIVRESA